MTIARRRKRMSFMMQIFAEDARCCSIVERGVEWRGKRILR
jgi:hypothetical protein